MVDTDPAPGRFLLTGSTNFLTVPSISESLAGRVRLLRLWPLSQAELGGTAPFPVESWFDLSGEAPDRPRPTRKARLPRRDYMEVVCRGGYPEALALSGELRRDWFESYVETVIERDVVALGDLRWHSAAYRQPGIHRRRPPSHLPHRHPLAIRDLKRSPLAEVKRRRRSHAMLDMICTQPTRCSPRSGVSRQVRRTCPAPCATSRSIPSMSQ